MSNPPHEERDKEIVERHYDKLSAFVHRQGVSREDGEDIVQKAFYNLVRSKLYDMTVDDSLPWLFRAANNLIIDFWRKRKGMLFFELETDGFDEIASLLLTDKEESPETDYLHRLFWQQFYATLKELPPEQREIFELTEFDGLSYHEISEQKNVNINTLLSRKRYAVQYLRKHLKDLYESLLEF